MLDGIIIKGIGGFYYVKVEDKIYECRARGLFRKKNITPLAGDKVEILISEIDDTGYIQNIKKRSNELIRPPVANINQAVIVFSSINPNPSQWLLDRFIILSESQNLDVVICINKIDLGINDELNNLIMTYEKIGYKVILTSTETSEGIDELKNILKDKITVFCGPSGVGKSSLLNSMQPNLKLITGEISNKTKRGKHTTRWAELLELNIGGWVVDTAGFSSLDINSIDKNELNFLFKEIHEYSELCKFTGCSHFKEPDCAVKQAVLNNEIDKERYENYLKFSQEIIDKRRY